ncbi:uncharacterized protein si:ch211-178n15.1 [Ctenopharyngodon idella]|uniref:uncharacterized protein si:ch211-178n15.1 n=1 Tax=Ctenopharyngodon idella TaxID=7959 RepID=UPI00222F0BC9|nr:uncharacterized protein si:ch211-178n15.1 [Ctenopharyngodon idella]
MHSENTRFQTPSCHFCLQQGPRRTPGPIDGSCLRMESGIAPFPKELGIDGGERTIASPPRQVYAKEIPHPCYSWVDVRAARWDSPCVREIRRECGCVQRWYYPELPHPFNGGHVLKVRGQRYYSSDQHYGHQREWDDVQAYNGQCTRRRVSFRHHEERHTLNGPEASRQSSPGKPHCNGADSGQAAFFPTEVPSSKLGRSGLQVNGPHREIRTSQGGVGLESHGNQRKSQGTVREQIKQVVTELEEVLGGLKQVQLEMKEVVQQIDILTSNIDLGEKEPSPSNGLSQDATKSSQTDVVALIHNSNGEEDTSTSDSSLAHSPVAVDLVHINSPSPMRNHTSSPPLEQRSVTVEDKGKRVVKQSSETQRTVNGSCLPHRTARKGQLENHRPPVVPVVCTNSNKTHRPPPYPQNGQVKMRTPLYPGKHKMLSSTIVD